MNITKLRSKRVLVTTAAVVALAAGGGGVWAATANADEIRADERDRVGAAAVRAVGGGTVLDVETGDDGKEAYEVEVRKQDGAEVDVTLDEDLEVLSQEADAAEAADGPETDDAPDPSASPDPDDRALTAAERASAEKAALAAVKGGTVTDVEAGDRRGVAYEVDVRAADGTEWDVEVDAAFGVLAKVAGS